MAGNESVIPVFLQQSILDAFRIQLSLEAQITASLANSAAAGAATSNLDLVSIMGIKATGFVGSVALGFPKATFLGVLESMLGEKHDDISSENADACSELLNIVYGSARVKINEAGFDFAPGIPSTIRGKELSLQLGQFSSFLRFTGETKYGPFLFAFSLRRSA